VNTTISQLHFATAYTMFVHTRA